MSIVMSEPVADVSVLTLDDEKVNAFDLGLTENLRQSLADLDGSPLVITGRPGYFSAGLDRQVIRTERLEELHTLLVAFGNLALDVWSYPGPVVAASTGHAVAGGAVLALATDYVVAASDEHYRWGLAEVQLGVPLPHFALEIAVAGRTSHRLQHLLFGGLTVTPSAAFEVGFIDELASFDIVVDRAVAVAQMLAQTPRHAYAGTKDRLRGDVARRLRERLEVDVRNTVASLKSFFDANRDSS